MRNITLSFPDDLVERGRDYARLHHISWNALIREAFRHMVYAGDADEPSKRHQARTLLSTHRSTGVISTQVLQEYYRVATRKHSVASMAAKAVLEQAAAAFELVTVSVDLIVGAVDRYVLWTISYWDALILSCAHQSACSIFYSEDLNHGQRYGQVTVVNPFV